MKFHPRLFLALSLAFLFTGIIGCLLHECGHAVVAKALGYRNVAVHYAYVTASGSDAELAMSACSDTVETLCLSGNRPGHPCAEQLNHWKAEKLQIRIGGPATNMLLGAIGFCIIVVSRRRFLTAQKLSTIQWAIVLLTFFWSRQIFNFGIGLLLQVRKGRWGSGDERFISRAWHLPDWSLDAITAAIGTAILATVVFYFIPRPQRPTFLLAGIVGSALCAYLWLFLLGPIIMP